MQHGSFGPCSSDAPEHRSQAGSVHRRAQRWCLAGHIPRLALKPSTAMSTRLSMIWSGTRSGMTAIIAPLTRPNNCTLYSGVHQACLLCSVTSASLSEDSHRDRREAPAQNSGLPGCTGQQGRLWRASPTAALSHVNQRTVANATQRGRRCEAGVNVNVSYCSGEGRHTLRRCLCA